MSQQLITKRDIDELLWDIEDEKSGKKPKPDYPKQKIKQSKEWDDLEISEHYGQVYAINDCQFGSVAKGAFSQYLGQAASAVVRIGAANAGHTMYVDDIEYVMRAIPCGWANLLTKLIIGRSAVISLNVLLKEIEKIHAIMPIKHRLFIDANAQVITSDQIERESKTGLAARISSTSAKSSLGISMARVDKILRDPEKILLAKDVPELQPYLTDTVLMINELLENDEIVILEGHQGFGLDIHHGYAPYTTSCGTTAADLFAGVGLNPHQFDVRVIGVIRTYPIRVGGPSGPFDPDSEELTWEELRIRSGATRDITERTSVTGSVRRVATFSWQGFLRACMVNRPTELAMTFADHIDATVYEQEFLTDKVRVFIDEVEKRSGIPVTMVKTGPKTLLDFDPYRKNMLRRMG